MPAVERTRAQALMALTQQFDAAGVDTAAEDARLLLRAACGLSRLDLATEPDAVITGAEQERLSSYAARRTQYEPVSRILGERGFWTLDLVVAPDVLDPRADTETLIETALRLCRDTPPTVDLSPHACRATMQNLRRCNLSDRAMVMRGRWSEALGAGRFDLIVSNPPYIATGDLAGLDPDVRLYDPALALDGGADGLDAYRAIIGDLTRLATPGALALFEVGVGQAGDVAALLAAASLTPAGVVRDLGGHERVVAARHGLAGPAGA
jgi:release factor glutamine methyltransferase